MGIHSLLQGIFPTQGSNTGLPSRQHATDSVLLFEFFFFFGIFDSQLVDSVDGESVDTKH